MPGSLKVKLTGQECKGWGCSCLRNCGFGDCGAREAGVDNRQEVRLRFGGNGDILKDS